MRWVVLAAVVGCGRLDFGESNDAAAAAVCAGATRWSVDFSAGATDPTLADRNGDGISDWTIRGGGAFPLGELTGSSWVTQSTEMLALDTAPGQDFLTRTVGSARFRNTIAGTSGFHVGADFWFNAGRTSTGFVVIYVDIVLESDSTQTASVVSWIDNPAYPADAMADSYIATTVTTVTGLDTGYVDATVDIDPTAPAVTVTIDGVGRGTFALPTYTNNLTPIRSATLAVLDGTGEFADATVDVCP